MTVEYLDLADYVAIAVDVTGLDLQTVMNVINLNLADSALHAPSAGFGEDDFYPDFVDKSAVLLVRLARNHPLPDGNARAIHLYGCRVDRVTGPAPWPRRGVSPRWKNSANDNPNWAPVPGPRATPIIIVMSTGADVGRPDAPSATANAARVVAQIGALRATHQGHPLYH